MKQLLALALGLLVVLISACTSDQSDMVSYNDITPKNQDYKFSVSEISLLNKLAAINDSIAKSNVESEDLTRASIDWGHIIKADAKGFKEGFKYGWSQGGSLKARFTTASLTAAIYAIAYSAYDAYEQITKFRRN